MSAPGPFGDGDFLGRMLGDILGLMGNSVAGGTDQLELARTLANSVATGGQPEPNVEPLAEWSSRSWPGWPSSTSRS